MTKYDIVTVLWQDHIQFSRALLPKDPDLLVDKPTLTVGILYKETEKTMTILTQIEPYADHDSADYIVVLKGTVIGIKRYGTIKLRKLGRG